MANTFIPRDQLQDNLGKLIDAHKAREQEADAERLMEGATVSDLTEFDYLLNRLECAAQQEKPADHHYGTHRVSLLRHVRALEKDAERYRWLRVAGAWESEIGLETLSQKPAKFDAAVDAAMQQGQE